MLRVGDIVPEDNNPVEEDSWHPFADRHDFDWADYHYVEVQSSEDTINRGLDLWMAEQIQVMQSTEGFTPPPWSSTKDLYKTIDAIEDGDVPFERVFFRYSGVIEENAPSWKTATYELCVRDVRAVVQQQMATPQFKEEFQTAPYRQYDRSGHRIYSNFMSGDWAWREAVSTEYSLCLMLHILQFWRLTSFRTKLRRIRAHTVPWLCQLMAVLTRPLFQSLQDLSNTTHTMYLLLISRMQLGVAMEMG